MANGEGFPGGNGDFEDSDEDIFFAEAELWDMEGDGDMDSFDAQNLRDEIADMKADRKSRSDD